MATYLSERDLRRIERGRRVDNDRKEKKRIEIVKLRDEKIRQKQLQRLNKSQTVDEIRRKKLMNWRKR